MDTRGRPLSVLLVSQYFSPENFGINGIAAELRERGHNVTVLTGMPNYPSGVFVEGYGGWKVRRENWNGVTVIRIPIVARGQKSSRLRLALNYLSYAINASIVAPFVVRSRPDIILVYLPSPITAALPAIVIKLIRGSKILFWVQDIWPESLIAAGAIESRLLVSLLRLLVRLLYRWSSIIAVQSPSFVDSIRPLAPAASDIRYFPNTADRFYRPMEVPTDAPERKLFRPGFNILFAGNLGWAQGLETTLAAIGCLKDRKDIQWVFIGDGRRRAWLEQQIQEQDLAENVQILGFFPAEKMPSFFAMADVLLITLADQGVFSLTVPSKLQTYLACGRPILGAVSGETANVLASAGAGFAAPPNDPQKLAELALAMARMPRERLDALGNAGLDYQRHYFNRDQRLEQLEMWLYELSPSPASSQRTTNSAVDPF